MTKPPLWPAYALVAALTVLSRSAAAQLPSGAPGTPGVAHPELPDTNADTCRVCHDNLFGGEFIHGSTAGPTCSGCHVFTGSGDATKVFFAREATRTRVVPLCAECHRDVAGRISLPGAHAPVASGDCLQCHSMHGAKSARLLATAAPELCITCHDTVGGELKRTLAHAPATADCSLCHEPHGAARQAQLRAPVNDLCLECHLAEEQQPQRGEIVLLFGRRPRRDTRALLEPSTRVALDPLRRSGHPVGNHPVQGKGDAAAKGALMTCVSCHAPHGSDLPALRRYGKDAMDLCTKCHK